jgi:HD-GYP domain-containing protein (c-di-GMP phosphodiesterase class II)
MEQKRLPVEALQFGMYIAELDRPWTETPFVFQGFLLRNDKQLEALKKYCKHVVIDIGRSETPDVPQPPGPGTGARFKIRGPASYPEAVPVEAEFRPALTAYAMSEQTVAELLRPCATAGQVLDAQAVKESVTRLTDSVVRNPDAMLLVSRLRESSAAAHARALQVSIYMIVFGRFLGQEREEIELLGLLGLLQDIGKTRLPADLLDKKDALTPQEHELAQRHVQFSVDILRATPGLPETLPELALLHHERQDGTGYPRGLKADAIGLYGSVAAIADTFDALTAVRPHAAQLSPSSALSYLYKERGTGFHAELVEQFIQCVGVFPVGSVVELNSGEVGIVITQNLVRRLKPRVMIVLDAAANPMRPHKILDLDKNPKVAPEEPYRIRRSLEQTKVQVDPRDLFI